MICIDNQIIEIDSTSIIGSTGRWPDSTPARMDIRQALEWAVETIERDLKAPRELMLWKIRLNRYQIRRIFNAREICVMLRATARLNTRPIVCEQPPHEELYGIRIFVDDGILHPKLEAKFHEITRTISFKGAIE